MTDRRTEDLDYGEDYWESLDGGAGYQDSNLWADLAHIVHETVGVDIANNMDRAMSMRVVDVGCALGFFVRHLRSRGYDVRGLEYSNWALDHAPEDIRFYLQQYDLTDTEPIADWVLEGGEAPFDVVTCFEVLEHIAAPSVDQACQHLFNALAPGGILLATICVVGQPDTRSDPTHVTVVPREWWERKFEACGFVPDDSFAQQLRWFWLFSQHQGIFTYRKPCQKSGFLE